MWNIWNFNFSICWNTAASLTLVIFDARSYSHKHTYCSILLWWYSLELAYLARSDLYTSWSISCWRCQSSVRVDKTKCLRCQGLLQCIRSDPSASRWSLYCICQWKEGQPAVSWAWLLERVGEAEMGTLGYPQHYFERIERDWNSSTSNSSLGRHRVLCLAQCQWVCSNCNWLTWNATLWWGYIPYGLWYITLSVPSSHQIICIDILDTNLLTNQIYAGKSKSDWGNCEGFIQR